MQDCSIVDSRLQLPGQPPISNTGVAGAAVVPVRCILVDYFSFTFTDRSDPASVLQMLNPDGWSPMQKGDDGYKQGFVRGFVTVLYDGRSDMGVHVRISGQGCRDLEARGVVDMSLGHDEAWQAFFRRMLAEGAKVTKLHLAHDDVDDYGKPLNRLSMAEIRRCVDEGLVASHYEWCEDGSRKRLKDRERLKDVIYFGSLNSQSYVTFYDKGIQRGLKESYIRCELRLAKKQAHTAVETIAAGYPIGELLAGLLRAKLDFKQPGSAVQMTRWKTQGWWDTFLEGVERLKLAVAPKLVTLASMKSWLEDGVAATFYTVWLYCVQLGHDEAWFKNFIARGFDRLGDKHKRLLREIVKGDVQALGRSVQLPLLN